MKFSMMSLFWDSDVVFFTKETAPDWLTSKNTVKGSTMDDRWFWNDHVLTLPVGKSVDTDYQRITRIE